MTQKRTEVLNKLMEIKEVIIPIWHVEAVLARYPNLMAQKAIKELIGGRIYELIEEQWKK